MLFYDCLLAVAHAHWIKRGKQSLVAFTVVKCTENSIECTVDNTNALGSNKHVRLVRHESDYDDDFRGDLVSSGARVLRLCSLSRTTALVPRHRGH